jgi:hypothetical protein
MKKVIVFDVPEFYSGGDPAVRIVDLMYVFVIFALIKPFFK